MVCWFSFSDHANFAAIIYSIIVLHSQTSVEGYPHPCSCAGIHLDYWAVCSGGRRESVRLPLCPCQCVSGESSLVQTLLLQFINKSWINYTYDPLISDVLLQMSSGFVHFPISCGET